MLIEPALNLLGSMISSLIPDQKNVVAERLIEVFQESDGVIGVALGKVGADTFSGVQFKCAVKM
jgi:hypothetical protein